MLMADLPHASDTVDSSASDEFGKRVLNALPSGITEAELITILEKDGFQIRKHQTDAIFSRRKFANIGFICTQSGWIQWKVGNNNTVYDIMPKYVVECLI